MDAVFEQEGQGYRVTRWLEHPSGTAILVEKHAAAGIYTRGLYSAAIQPRQGGQTGPAGGPMGEWQRRGPLVFRHGEVRRRYTGYTLLKTVFERVCTGCDREPDLSERQCRACGGRIQDRMQDHKLSEHPFDEVTELEPLHTRALEVGIDPKSSDLPDAVAHTLKHLLQKLIPERVACDENDVAGAFGEGRPTYFFLYDDWKGGLGVPRRA